MKKTIWQPLILGTRMGILAGICNGYRPLISHPRYYHKCNRFLWDSFAALRCPRRTAGRRSSVSIIFLVISALFGSPEMKAVITIPAVFWSNVLMLWMIETLAGFGYRFIFERLKMPGALATLGWNRDRLLSLEQSYFDHPTILLIGGPAS